jgi:molecular chaperone GrpE
VTAGNTEPDLGDVGESVPEGLAGTGSAPQPGPVDLDSLEHAMHGDAEEAAPADGSAVAEGSTNGDGAVDNRDAQIAELTDRLQRLQAEFANYKRRQDRDRPVVVESAKATVLGALLPVLDDLDRARAHGDLESGPLKSVADKLAGVFDGLGVVRFGVEGEPFDPAVHEAVQHEGDGSNPVLGVVMRQGYRFGEKVLRTAMVGVVDAVPDAPNGDSGEADPASAPDQQ